MGLLDDLSIRNAKSFIKISLLHLSELCLAHLLLFIVPIYEFGLHEASLRQNLLMLFLHLIVCLNILQIFSLLQLISKSLSLSFGLDLLNQVLARIVNVVPPLYILSLHPIYERLRILVHIFLHFAVVLAILFVFCHRKIGLRMLLVLFLDLLLARHTFDHSLHMVIVILHERCQVC